MIPRRCHADASCEPPVAARSIDLASKVAFLSRPESYPERPSGVEVVQTHMSFVFLTDHHAYKLKKPVRYEFLDFSTLEARRIDCLEEIRLNRRLARNVYLDVVALTQGPQGRLHLGGDGEALEHLVRMRRLPREQMFDHALRSGRAGETDVRRIVRVLTEFYARAEPARMSAAQYRRRFEHDIDDLRRELASPDYGLDRSLRDSVTNGQIAFLGHHGELLDRRATDQRIVEGHGDLRPEHICLGPEPCVIDCLEFNREWRLVDPADEVAYLAMECEYIGAPWVGEVAFDEYRERARDHPPAELTRFYKSCRASLRAKLSAWHLRDHPDPTDRRKWTERARVYLELAGRYARPS